MFITALFTISNVCNQLRSPMTEEWIKIKCGTYTQWSIIQPQEWNYIVCTKMEGAGDQNVELDKLSSNTK
jgi:hypothetical protein